MSSLHHSFGQEFYPHESIRALRIAEKMRFVDRHSLVEHIAESLPQPSVHTRWRIAEKLVRRYLTNSSGYLAPPHEQPFVRLVARQRHAPAQIELLYLRLTQTDTLVGALAREIFYPVCIAHRPPDGVESAVFGARNGGHLFGFSALWGAGSGVSPQITRSFLHQYALEQWHFTNAASLDRALRILQTAGLITRRRMSDLRRHPTAYCLSHHNVSLTAFIWALYDEFLQHAYSSGNATLAPDVPVIADLARTLLLTREQIEAHCELACRHGFLSSQGQTLSLSFGNMNALVDALLSHPL